MPSSPPLLPRLCTIPFCSCQEDHAGAAFAARMRLPLLRAPRRSPSSHLGCAKPKTTPQNQRNAPFLYPQPCLETTEMDPPRSLFPAGAAVPVPAVAAVKPCRDGALILGSAAAHRLRPRLGFSCWPSGAVPVPPRPRSCLVVPHRDKNTSPAAAHLVPETSLGNGNKKLKIKG